MWLQEIEYRFERWIDATVKERVKVAMQSMGSGVPPDPVPTSFSPQFRGCSSCGSTPLDEKEVNAPHPLDSITEPIFVRLYIHQQWTTDKVVVGQA